MKPVLTFILLLFMFFPAYLKAQIKKVDVETYYISDSYDNTDTTAGRRLDSGSKTYRVYVNIEPGFKLKKIYGDANHALKISSTDNFYNNIDRPNAYFGYLINKSWLSDNPTLALDSWLTIGLATKTHMGVLKSEDTDGTISEITNNYGGTAGIAGGLLVNADSSAFVPFSVADGLAPNSVILSQWLDDGFKDITNQNADTTIFGSVNSGSQFISNTAFLQQNDGVMGVSPGNNKVLVAQLTTRGEISFELNVELLDSLGNTLKFVAGNDTLLPDEIVCPFLKYPLACGCTDPNYIEYNANYGCGNPDSCKTRIVFGCMDIMACNYDPNVNFNIQSLCCYPGSCSDRDIAVVCPNLINERNVNHSEFSLYPNPAQANLTLKFTAGDKMETNYSVYNSFGALVLEKNMGLVTGAITHQVDLSKLDNGLYLVRLSVGNNTTTKMFMKN